MYRGQAVEEKADIIRKQVNSPLLYRILGVVFALFFGAAVVLAILANPNQFYFYSLWMLVVCAAVGCTVFYLILYLFKLVPSLPKAAQWVGAALMFILFAAFAIWAGGQLKIHPPADWAFGQVFSLAQKYILEKQSPGNYFLYHPQDTGLYVVLCGVFNIQRAFGGGSAIDAGVTVNTIAILATVLLLYGSVRYTFGGTKALLALVLCFFSLPLVLYTPIVCAETLALPFGMLAVLLWQVARKNWRAGEVSSASTGFCFMSVFAGLGAFIYWPLLVVWLAAVIDLLFYLRGKGKLRIAAGGLVLCGLVLVGLTFVVWDSALIPEFDPATEGVPALHFVRTGLEWEYAPIEDELEAYAALPGKQARYEDDVAAIQRWFARQGAPGVLAHLSGRLSHLFGDGTYGAPASLAKDPVLKGFLYSKIVPDQSGFAALGYTSFAVQIALLIWVLVSAVKSILRRNDYFTFLRNILLFASLVFLVWPATARNMLPFLPMLLLCAIEGGPTRTKRPAHSKSGQRRASQPPSPALAAALQGHKVTEEEEQQPLQTATHVPIEAAFAPEPLPQESEEGPGQPVAEEPPQKPAAPAPQAPLPQAVAENTGTAEPPAQVDILQQLQQQTSNPQEWELPPQTKIPTGPPAFETVSAPGKAPSITQVFAGSASQTAETPTQWESEPVYPQIAGQSAAGPEAGLYTPQQNQPPPVPAGTLAVGPAQQQVELTGTFFVHPVQPAVQMEDGQQVVAYAVPAVPYVQQPPPAETPTQPPVPTGQASAPTAPPEPQGN